MFLFLLILTLFPSLITVRLGIITVINVPSGSIIPKCISNSMLFNEGHDFKRYLDAEL